MFSLVRYGPLWLFHSGDEVARGFSTSHSDIFLAIFSVGILSRRFRPGRRCSDRSLTA